MKTGQFLLALAAMLAMTVGCSNAARVPTKVPDPLSAINTLPADAPMILYSEPDASPSASPPTAEEEDADELASTNAVLAEVMTLISESYVRSAQVTDRQLRYGAIKGIVASLDDPYSEFLNPEEAKQFREMMDGKFYGIGATLGIKDGRVTVTKLAPDSPAHKAGMKQGDVIAEVDGESTFDVPLTKTVSRIRGENGKPVKLTVLREGLKKPLELSIVRGKVTTQPEKLTSKVVRGFKGKKVMLISIPEFDNEAAANFQIAAQDAREKGVTGIIVDLRNNPGGLLWVAEFISCAWLTEGQAAVVISHPGDLDEAQRCDTDGALKGIPTVVLINKNSASASEIVAGALKDHKVAHIVGETSFGKGSVQVLRNFPDGSMLRLTVNLWKTPNGHHINKIGITPDIEIKSSDDPEEEKNGKDEQLQHALHLLTHGDSPALPAPAPPLPDRNSK